LKELEAREMRLKKEQEEKRAVQREYELRKRMDAEVRIKMKQEKREETIER
jgi:hypothetical protein